MSDIYSNPEKFGLTYIGQVDFTDGYEFDLYAVWKDQDGKFWYGSDSGCSCPSPFEDYDDEKEPLRDLDELTSLAAFKDLCEAYAKRSSTSSTQQEIVELVERLHKAGVR
jgi:hypothetical protein